MWSMQNQRTLYQQEREKSVESSCTAIVQLQHRKVMESSGSPPVYANASPLPSGMSTFSRFPDFLMIFEFVFGGLVWILVAATELPSSGNWQGWVMFVSIGCFLFTSILIIMYCMGAHGGKSSWISLDAFYHCTAALFYLSASVLQANLTIFIKFAGKLYQENVAAAVFAYLTTLSYVIHAVYSLMRWKMAS